MEVSGARPFPRWRKEVEKARRGDVPPSGRCHQRLGVRPKGWASEAIRHGPAKGSVDGRAHPVSVEQGDYGPVRILAGPHKGSLGYYGYYGYYNDAPGSDRPGGRSST